jgi:hypothetical protein
MSGAANNGTYGNPGMGHFPWNSHWSQSPTAHQPAWSQPGWDRWTAHWHSLPKTLRIIAVVLGFMLWWPVGLALLLYSLWSGRMGCRGYYRHGGYQAGTWQGGGAPPWAGWWRSWCNGGERPAQSSGNRAFDEYRAETLRRLEEEQKEFGAFLDRLRFAKDKAEFDQFMTELRQRPQAPPDAPPQG